MYVSIYPSRKLEEIAYAGGIYGVARDIYGTPYLHWPGTLEWVECQSDKVPNILQQSGQCLPNESPASKVELQ